MATREDDITAWMPWFPRDFLAATAGLSAVDGWAYTQLLNHMWIEHGQLPFDHAELARLGRVTPLEWVATWGRLSRFFDVDVAAGKVTQRRLSLEREKALELRRARVDAGRKGGSTPRNGTRRRSNASAKASSQPAAASPDSAASPQAGAKQRSKIEANAKPSPSPSPSPPSSPPAGSGEQTRAARPPRPLELVIEAFRSRWLRKYGVEYVVTDADRAELGRLWKRLPPDRPATLPACFDRYLEDPDEFIVRRKRHSLAWFVHEGGENKYLVTVPALSAKQARTAAALAKFVNGGGDGRAG